MRCRLRATPRFYLILIAVLVLGFGLNCALAALQLRRLDRRAEALEAQRQAQTQKLETLGRKLEYAQTDACVEHIARSRLNLLYPGEIRYIAD